MPLPAQTTTVGGRHIETRSILTLKPTREDDETKFRCVVWNRAMAEGHRLETFGVLNVNCKCLEIDIKQNRNQIKVQSVPK